MRRLLLTGDWHLSENPRDAYRFTAVGEIAKLIGRHKVDDLFILGDLTDFAEGHSPAFTNRVVELLATLAGHCCVHILRGNHDASDPQVPFFRFINTIEHCRFITETTGWEADGFKVLLIPNGCWATPLKADGYDAVFTHHTFAGAQGEHDFRLHGLRLPLTDVPIYSGDVHVPQQQGMVTYVGAPTLIKFGDSYQPRVIFINTALDGPVGKRMYATIPIHGPTKRLVEVVAHPDGKIAWPKGEVNKDDLVKVRVRFSGVIPSLAHLRADIAANIGRLGAALYSIEPVTEKRTTILPRTPTSRSDTDLVRQYASARKLDKPTVEVGLGIVKGGTTNDNR